MKARQGEAEKEAKSTGRMERTALSLGRRDGSRTRDAQCRSLSPVAVWLILKANSVRF